MRREFRHAGVPMPEHLKTWDEKHEDFCAKTGGTGAGDVDGKPVADWEGICAKCGNRYGWKGKVTDSKGCPFCGGVLIYEIIGSKEQFEEIEKQAGYKDLPVIDITGGMDSKEFLKQYDEIFEGWAESACEFIENNPGLFKMKNEKEKAIERRLAKGRAVKYKKYCSDILYLQKLISDLEEDNNQLRAERQAASKGEI